MKYLTTFELERLPITELTQFVKHYCVHSDLHLDEMEKRNVSEEEFERINQLRNKVMDIYNINQKEYGKI